MVHEGGVRGAGTRALSPRISATVEMSTRFTVEFAERTDRRRSRHLMRLSVGIPGLEDGNG